MPHATGRPLLVDVIVRTKDRPLFLARALRSIRAQTWGRVCVHIVNDGGARDAAEIGKAEHGDALDIHVHHLAESVGPAETLNVGLRACQGDLMAIHDDDDSWHPYFLAAMVRRLETTSKLIPNVGGSACHLRRVFEHATPDGIVYSHTEGAPPQSASRGIVNAAAFAARTEDLFPIQVLLDRRAAQEVGGFDPIFLRCEDREFLNRFLARYEITILQRELAFHHTRMGGTSASFANSMANMDLIETFVNLIDNRRMRSNISVPARKPIDPSQNDLSGTGAA
ncbi:Glycosyl transferase family 2 [Faunimonas pinastri]|uniref:Glycosyl transferase family 2 n=1 Tax=Faunimonas pinastri TaxID=1855383 RepID=A0A1H9CNF6_9HYPH|nr:glycosyltransferase family A protein [Faunimonas pinastri]SEQ02726.1 Glycosyl transferase family 2 [Faunimonas pinastri]